ncbi:MAG: alpha/beta fold hydrolase [Clostridia bacterium]|nr:alpha/beta fold hydrolase [Clostridia bacterium]
MNKARKNYINDCRISQLVTLNLGGYPQKVLIEGYKSDLPVVIALHGGPGSPVPFGVGCRGLFPEWTKKAIMVFWDQLGCGANNYKIGDNFKIENFVDMTVDLITEIKARFPQNKLFLFGVSWGSILALEAAARVPEKLNGALVYGQITKNLFFNNEIKSAFFNAPVKVQGKIAKIFSDGTNCDYKILDKNLKTLYKLLNKHTNAYTNKNAKPVPVGKIAKGLLTSPDYSFADFKAVVKNGYNGNQSLWRELLNADYSQIFSKITVPYAVLQGDTDTVTSTSAVKAAAESCNNKNVTVKIIKNSGHMPSQAAMEECFNTLCELIK